MQFPTLFKTVSGGALAALLFCVSLSRAETLTGLNTEEQDDVAAQETAVEETSETPDSIDPEVWAGLETHPAGIPHLVTRLSPRDITAPEWHRADRLDGTGQITIRKPLPLDWDAKVGADFSTATPLDDRSLRPLPVVNDRSAGAAYVNVAVPNLAAVELRVNSDPDRNKVGAAFMRSLPLGEKYAVTFESRYALSEPAGAPMPSAIAPPRTWSTDRLVKFDLLTSGTTLAVGTTTSTADNVTHGKLIAEQKIYGPFNVTTALTDIGTPAAAKSITAGFKLNW